MRPILTLIAIIGGFFIALLAGNKFMVWKYEIPTRMEADNQGKAYLWDRIMLISVAIVIGIGLFAERLIFAETISIIGLPAPTWLSWIYAAYWLLAGYRDFTHIRYVSPGGIDRYKEPLPLLNALFMSFDLFLLGLFIATSQSELTVLTLLIFGALSYQWDSAARRLRKERKALEERRKEEIKRLSSNKS